MIVNKVLKINKIKYSIIKCISSETQSIPTRNQLIEQIKQSKDCDVLVIGGGCTGVGVALDAALRGLKVVCVEREDISSGTSSRSTKLLWGGSRYLVTSLVSLFNHDLRLIRKPKETIQKFLEEFKMVMNCHRERRFLLNKQPHLTNWLPIAVPLTKWLIWPPPFNYPPAVFGPLGLFPLFFKFYDALSGYNCPPSHIMSTSRARRKFPQLAVNDIKYCSVFYEGQHDDARTNLSIALTAAKNGASIANYCDVIKLIKDSHGKVIGATIQDKISNEQFDVLAKSVIFCGGPFTDELRKLDNPNCENVVKGAGGIHIVIPGYYAPSNFGLVDMATSDGRFLFYLPWEGHVLIGTTDHPSEPSMRPVPSEREIQWILAEASKYLTKELKMRRQDVLSAWSGIRPLAGDPNSDENTASVSRDHVISYNPSSDVIFVAGGKWTTYREMAEDAVNKVLEVKPYLNKNLRPCSTLDTHFVGYEGYSTNLPLRLIQTYGIPQNIANHLAKAYGGRSFDVIDIQNKELQPISSKNIRLVPDYPYIDAEVIFAARYEWAVHAEDILARRTRLAFLNKNVSIDSIPKIVQLMSKELKWTDDRCKEEELRCLEFMNHFGGPQPM